jgi:Immunity protein Imm1
MATTARYLDPESREMVEVSVTDAADLRSLFGTVGNQISPRGYPMVELAQPGGSLVVGLCGDRAVLSWGDGDHSLHSVGTDTTDDLLVFDYMGHYTEIPIAAAVPIEVATRAAVSFVMSGSPTVQDLVLEKDW